jgi:TetR/AcrR family transcriptional regulator, cholesterol catabolism regulator
VQREETTSTARGEENAAPAPPAVESLDELQRQRRARIVDTAISMMTTTEYDRIQMKDVSAAAGVALGTTYRYFASKEHLMSEALLTWSTGFPSDAPSAGGRSVDRLKLAFRLAVRAFEPHPTVYGAMVVLQASTDSYAAAVFQQFAAHQTAAFERFLPRIAAKRRTAIVMVMSAVLDTQLRNWSVGRVPIEHVYRALDTAAELILDD